MKDDRENKSKKTPIKKIPAKLLVHLENNCMLINLYH